MLTNLIRQTLGLVHPPWAKIYSLCLTGSLYICMDYISTACDYSSSNKTLKGWLETRPCINIHSPIPPPPSSLSSLSFLLRLNVLHLFILPSCGQFSFTSLSLSLFPHHSCLLCILLHLSQSHSLHPCWHIHAPAWHHGWMSAIAFGCTLSK